MIALETLTVGDYLSILKRRKWVVLAGVLFGFSVAMALGEVIPKSYRSSTLIMVDTPKIPDAYVRPVVGGSVAERLTTIQQQVLSRTALTKIIEEFDLYSGDSGKNDNDTDLESRIERLHKAIKIETKGGGRIEGFSISFADEDPTRAMKVTARLASQFIEENLKVREQLVEGTTEFLDQELARAKSSLEEQEKRISEFKTKYMGELPGQTEANLQALNRLQKELLAMQSTLQSRLDRKTALQRTISMYEAMGIMDASIPQDTVNRLSPEEQDEEGLQRDRQVRNKQVQMRPNGIDPDAARLKELERTLAALLAEYKESYPDVQSVKKQIAVLKSRLVEKYKMATLAQPEGPVAPDSKVDPYLVELKREMEENEVGLASLQQQVKRLTALVGEYEGRVERAPRREEELLVLERDYEITKKNYQALLEKQLNARISENLEKRQKGETFRVLDPANLPTKPEWPNRPKLFAIGATGGLLLGYGAAFWLECLVWGFRRPEDAEKVLGLPVLAVIPDYRTAYNKGDARALPSPGSLLSQVMPVVTQRRKDVLISIGSAQQKHSHTQRVLMNGGSHEQGFKRELDLVARWRPDSLVAEQFRVAATRMVLTMNSGRKGQVVLVTSSVPGEGKTSVTANLGYVLARDLGKDTLVIDCDFKRPSLSLCMGTPDAPGLADLLLGDASIEQCLYQVGDVPLRVLPGGRKKAQRTDLTDIQRLKDVLNKIRQGYDFILLDTPPVIPLADVSLLVGLADFLLLVVRAGTTPQEMVKKAVKALPSACDAAMAFTQCEIRPVMAYFQGYYASPAAELRREVQPGLSRNT